MLVNKKSMLSAAFALGMAFIMGSCSNDDDSGTTPTPEKGSYVIAVRVPGSGSESTDYLIQTKDLMTGTISAKGAGNEQSGFHTYSKVGSSIVSIGGLGLKAVTSFGLNNAGELAEKGSFTFDDKLDVFTAVDDNTIASIAISLDSAVTTSQYFNANINSSSISGKVNNSLNPLFFKGSQVWQSGIVIRDGKAFVPYYIQNKGNYATAYTDTAYVAIYGYPGFTFEKVIKDTRTGPAGSFNTNSGIIKTENGDLYTISTNSYGYTQSTKPSAILRIKNGETTFDQSYFFDIEAATKAISGYKMYNHYYLGNGLVLAEISTVAMQGQWDYKSLKLAIVDLNNKAVKEVTGTPVHSGLGGNTVQYLIENGKIYYPLTNDAGELYIYQIDATTAVATKGAKIEGSSAPGVFKL